MVQQWLKNHSCPSRQHRFLAGPMVMKFLYIFIFCWYCISCTNNASNENNYSLTDLKVESSNSIPKDSSDYWVSLDYLNSLDSAISICDCWKQNKYHFLSYDTTKMELYLKSNLLHYGHDSEIILPMKKSEFGFKYDSTLNNWPIPNKEFAIPTNDTLKLQDGGKEFLFVRKSYPISDKQKDILNNSYSEIRDLFYNTSSQLLMKYTKNRSK